MVSNNAMKIKPNDVITNQSDALAYDTLITLSLIPSRRKTVDRIIVISRARRSAMFDDSMKNASQERMTKKDAGMYTCNM
ncbi:Hypothetical predicted protein [Paramuricea clavata]|uniref:Uncharacterized protein n=1 Tax=Paramuricea clavata TaxID=317549 RepID=A0A7D9MDH9_PARCT|nr:Hypothetical predicted protein [Paramuricea clavata]